MFEFIKRAVSKLIPKQSIMQAYGIQSVQSSKMQEHIALWETMMTSGSLNLPNAITREFSNICISEMTAKVKNPALDSIFQTAISDLSINFQKGLGSGAMVIKPVGTNKIQYIPQSAFIPLEYDANGRLVKVIFPEIKKISDFNYYIRLEYHNLDFKEGLTITNRAFHSSSPNVLGTEISLKKVDEWSKLPPKAQYSKMLKPAFGYYVNPIANQIDGSFAGVSIFASAVDLIKLADAQFKRLDWEFESAKRRINVDEQAIRDGKLSELYCAFDVDGLFEEFSPALREQNFITGLNEYKRSIEFAVGLAYGDLSNTQSVEKTATEIKSAKERKYQTVCAIQKNLKTCLEDLAYSLAFFNAKTAGFEFNCTFKDSILADEQAERQQDLQDMQAGILRPEEYRAKWYGESIEEAAKNLPQSAEVLE